MQHFARLSMRIFINYASDLIKNLTSCRLERHGTEQRDRLVATPQSGRRGRRGRGTGPACNGGNLRWIAAELATCWRCNSRGWAN